MVESFPLVGLMQAVAIWIVLFLIVVLAGRAIERWRDGNESQEQRDKEDKEQGK